MPESANILCPISLKILFKSYHSYIESSEMISEQTCHNCYAACTFPKLSFHNQQFPVFYKNHKLSIVERRGQNNLQRNNLTNKLKE
jgi:hypothetical protein